jgi:hypothetical protein
VLSVAFNDAEKSERPVSLRAVPGDANHASAGVPQAQVASAGRLQHKRAAANPISALHQLLTVFAGSLGWYWRAYDDIPGVVWHKPAAEPCPDVGTLDASHARTASMLLLGYAEVDLPDPSADDGFGVRRGNEGESSLSLNGDCSEVHEIAIVKYYPDDDAGRVLSRQLPETAEVTLIGSDESPGEPATRWCYSIRIPDHGQVFADIAHEEGGPSGPGYTTFVLTRNPPRTEGLEMRCREE